MNLAELIMFSRSMRILGLTIMLAFGAVWLWSVDPGKIVSENRREGVIVAVDGSVATVRLDDESEVRVPTPKVMATNNSVILRERTYDSGHRELVVLIEDQIFENSDQDAED